MHSNPTHEPATTAPSPGWSFFDRIFCITLAHREDRRRSATEQFRALGLLPRVQFVVVDKDLQDSERGIFSSHMRCLRQGLESDAQTILVFEDDVLFERFSTAALVRAVRFLRIHPDWSVFFLGCFVRKSKRTDCPDVVNVRFGFSAHAYAMNRRFAEDWIRTPWTGVAYDDQLRLRQDDHVFSLFPSIAFQSDSTSDNENTPLLARTRRLMGGVRRLQKLNEFIHRHTVLIVTAHLAAIFLLAVSTLTRLFLQ